MHMPTLIAALAMMSSGALVSAAPSDMTKRANGPNNPTEITIDCTNVPNLCEARCMAMYCFGVPQTYQYKKGINGKNRQNSGVKSNPFRDGRAAKNTIINPKEPNWLSPEETIRASAVEGGWGTPLIPVDDKENSREGSLYLGQLKTHNVKSGDYVKELHDKANGKYCTALRTKNPNPASVCKSSGQDDFINYIQWKTSTKKGRSYQYAVLKYGTDNWAKGHPEPPKKRDVTDESADFSPETELESFEERDVDFEDEIEPEEDTSADDAVKRDEAEPEADAETEEDASDDAAADDEE